MAEPAGTLVSVVLQRVRDAGGVAITRDYARSIVSLSQRHINTFLELVTEDATFLTLTQQQLYSVFAAPLNKAAKLLWVRDGTRTLGRINWRELGMVDRQWFRRIGTRFESWGTVGRGIWVLHPSLDHASMVTVTYAKWTEDLVQDSTPTELPDEHLPSVLDLAETIVSVRMRQFEPARAAMKRLADRLKVEIESDTGKSFRNVVTSAMKT